MARLDDQALIRLRQLVSAMHSRRGQAVPMRELVELAANARLDAGVTVDFEASRSLGHPMIVLRMPEAGERTPASLACLSPRERQVADLIGGGLANKEIAASLGVTVGTVKDHVHRILEKTGLPNRAAVAVAARCT
jgi:DNA-binding CsgD family transcriptional regulator